MPEATASLRRPARLLVHDLVVGDEMYVDYPERTMCGHGWRVAAVHPISPTHATVVLECSGRTEAFLWCVYEEVLVWRRTCQECGRRMASPGAYWQSNVPECSYCLDGVARPA